MGMFICHAIFCGFASRGKPYVYLRLLFASLEIIKPFWAVFYGNNRFRMTGNVEQISGACCQVAPTSFVGLWYE